jgi:cell wall integrity and stress response component
MLTFLQTTSTPHQTTSHQGSATPTWSPTPVVSLYTTTGEVRTVTVTPTVPPNSQNLATVAKKHGGGGGLSTGAAVGLTVGLVALVAIISTIIYFCVRRRQKERQRALEEVEESRSGSTAGLGGPIPSRTMSENSRYVLNTDGRQVVESYEGDLPGSRRSRLVPVDPRLNPHAPLYQRGENKSRESVNTINDHHDYSRKVHQQGVILRATNPDD